MHKYICIYIYTQIFIIIIIKQLLVEETTNIIILIIIIIIIMHLNYSSRNFGNRAVSASASRQEPTKALTGSAPLTVTVTNI